MLHGWIFDGRSADDPVSLREGSYFIKEKDPSDGDLPLAAYLFEEP